MRQENVIGFCPAPLNLFPIVLSRTPARRLINTPGPHIPYWSRLIPKTEPPGLQSAF